MSKATTSKALADGKRDAKTLSTAAVEKMEDARATKALRSYVAHTLLRWQINGPSSAFVAKIVDTAHNAWHQNDGLTVQEAEVVKRFSNFVRTEGRAGNEPAKTILALSRTYVSTLGLRGMLKYQAMNVTVAHNVLIMASVPIGYNNDEEVLKANELVARGFTAALQQLRKELEQPALLMSKDWREGAD